MDCSAVEPVPVPDTGIRKDRDPSLSPSCLANVINRAPSNVSLVGGVNVTTKLALPPGVKVIGMAGVLMVKAVPFTVALWTTKSLWRLSVMVNVVVALLPTATEPKARSWGLTL